MAVRPHSETLGPVIPRSGAGAWHVVCGCVRAGTRHQGPCSQHCSIPPPSTTYTPHSTSPYQPPPTTTSHRLHLYNFTPSYRLHLNRHMILLHGLVLMFTINYACKPNTLPVVPSICTANCNIFCGHLPFKSQLNI